MKEIARILKITPRTVAFHKYSMMEELGVRSSAELVQYAIKKGVVHCLARIPQAHFPRTCHFCQ